MKTLGNKIKIKIKETSAGDLNLDSMPTANEFGEVLDTGPDVKATIKKGDKILFKAWAVDIINHEGVKHYFLDLDTKGLCAIIVK